jgi:hypothetical protein
MNEKQEWFNTMNLKAATSIATLGVEKRATCRVVRADGKESTVFWFGESKGEIPSAEHINHWTTKGHLEIEDAESLLMSQLNKDQRQLFYKAVCYYLYCSSHTRDNLISEIKQIPRMIEITNGSRRALIAENASDETKRKIASML